MPRLNFRKIVTFLGVYHKLLQLVNVSKCNTMKQKAPIKGLLDFQMGVKPIVIFTLGYFTALRRC